VKLNNLGLIFDINKFEPFKNYTHAQSPQLFQLNDINRIYFSSRPLKKKGELPSTEVLFVDYDSDFKKIVDYSKKPVLGPAILGAYDEHGVFPFHVCKIENHLFGYISGWSRRVSVAVETSIGISESFDNGSSFQRIGNGPILSASQDEPFLVGDPFVIKYGDDFIMYYIAGTDWKKTEAEYELQRVYKIRMAVSKDGEKWKPLLKNIVSNVLGIDECQALPSVVSTKNGSKMAFCYREISNFRTNGKNAYKLGFAESSDLVHWKRNDDLYYIPNHPSEWDTGMRCYPNIHLINNRVAIFYNGNDFGKNGFGLALEE